MLFKYFYFIFVLIYPLILRAYNFNLHNWQGHQNCRIVQSVYPKWPNKFALCKECFEVPLIWWKSHDIGQMVKAEQTGIYYLLKHCWLSLKNSLLKSDTPTHDHMLWNVWYGLKLSPKSSIAYYHSANDICHLKNAMEFFYILVVWSKTSFQNADLLAVQVWRTHAKNLFDRFQFD